MPIEVTKIARGKFGPFASFADGKTKSISESVSKWLTGKTPCLIEVIESDQKGTLTKVKVLSQLEPESAPQQAYQPTREPYKNNQASIEMTAHKRRKCDCGMKAVDAFIAGKIERTEVLDFANGLFNWVEEEPEFPVVKPGQ